MKKILSDLYNQLDELQEYKLKIIEIEDSIRHFKYNCEHPGAIVLEEGTELDGYDRNDYYAKIKCSECDSVFNVYAPWATAQYKVVEGVTKFNCRN
jgi:hypothetical protein